MVKGPCCILDPKVVRKSRRKSLDKPIGPLMVYNARNMSRLNIFVLAQKQ